MCILVISHTNWDCIQEFYFEVVIVREILKKMIHIFLNGKRVETETLNVTILNSSDDSDSLEHSSYSSVPLWKSAI